MVERYIANLATTKFVHSLLSKDLTVALKLGYLKGGYVSHQSYQFQCVVPILLCLLDFDIINNSFIIIALATALEGTGHTAIASKVRKGEHSQNQ